MLVLDNWHVLFIVVHLFLESGRYEDKHVWSQNN